MTVSARATLVAVCVSAAFLLPAAIKQPIRRPTYDPAVPVVALFEAIDSEVVETTVIARSSHDANLFVTNKSAEPVSVQLPQVVGAVHVLKQLALPGNNGAANGPGANGPGANGPGNGQGQPIGGGVQNRGTNGPGNFNNMAAGPLFSIPSGRTIQLPLKTVCLAYGRPDPHPRLQYRLVRVEEVAGNSDLQKTLEKYVAGEIDTQATQAAAWHLKDGMSWKKLAETRVGQIGGLPGDPLFTEKEIDDARQLVEKIREESTNVAGKTSREVSSRRKE